MKHGIIGGMLTESMESSTSLSLSLSRVALVLGLLFPTQAFADIRQGICRWEKDHITIEQKTCVIDFFNSGNIQIITNNGTLNFNLDDSRLSQYSLNGVLYLKQEGSWYGQGSFTEIGNPSNRLYYGRFR